MKPLNARQIAEYLRGLGFVPSHGVGSHRGMFNPVTGKCTVIPFHGNEPLPQGTLNAICRQAGVPKPQR